MFSWKRNNGISNIVTLKGKGEGKIIPVLLTEHHTMKAYWGSGGIAPRILDLVTRWR
jgi:hypothetical protein